MNVLQKLAPPTGESSSASSVANHSAVGPTYFADEAARLASFARSLDALHAEIDADLGAEDVAHIRRVVRLARVTEIAGRTLIHVSLDPITFTLGVASLSVHKLLMLMEIGHTVLHGAYDKLPGAEPYRSESFRWKAPVDEKSWCRGHNVRHHQYTNVAGRDPDLDFGLLRLSDRIRYSAVHRLQPVSNWVSWFFFSTAINLHVTGMLEIYMKPDETQLRTRKSVKAITVAHVAFLRKQLRYYTREYVFFPALAGPMFRKTLLGNGLSEVVRDVYAAAIIYCGHVGAEDYPPETRGRSRAGFYVLQVEGTCDVDLPPPPCRYLRARSTSKSSTTCFHACRPTVCGRSRRGSKPSALRTGSSTRAVVGRVGSLSSRKPCTGCRLRTSRDRWPMTMR